MAESLPPDKAKEIARVVLNRHSVSVDAGAISQALELASDNEFFLVAGNRRDHEVHRARLERIERLNAVLEAYKERANANGDRYFSHEDYHLRRMHGTDLRGILNSLEWLRETETMLAEILEPEPIPNERPTTAKHAGAELIWRTLDKCGIRLWPSCAIIADMLIEAGIDDRTRNKVQRSLYDKLKRR